MGKLLDFLKRTAGQASLHSPLGQWRQKISVVVDQLQAAFPTFAGTAVGQILVWDGTSWVPQSEGTAIGQFLVWDGTTWVPGDVLDVENGGTGSSRSLDASPVTIQFVGDSITSGVNGAWRSPCFATLRQWRDDFDFVGTQLDGILAIDYFGLPYSDAIAGQTLDGAAAAYTGQVAALAAPPDVIVDMLGTNDIAGQGQTAAQMMTDRETLEAAYAANSPNAVVIALGTPPFVAGSTTGGNLAAWNATRAQYNALLQAYCATHADHHFISTNGLGLGDFLSDGVHLNNAGEAQLGRIVAEYLDRHLLNPLSRGQRLTWSTFRQSSVMPSITSPAAGYATVTTAAQNPASESYAFALDYYPTELPTGFHSVVSYDVYNGATGWFGLYQNADALAVYWNNPAPTIANTANSANRRCLRANRWHRVLLIAHRNGADSRVGLYVDGRLVGIAIGLPAWTMSQHALRINNGPDFGGIACYFGRFSTWKGAGIPVPGSSAALLAAERDYWLGESLFPGYCTSSYPLGTTLNDEISGGPAMTLVAGAASSPAWPSGTPLRPWEYGPDGDKLVALGGGAAPTLGTIGGLGPAAAAQNSWVRMTDSTGAAVWVPAWK